MKSQDALTLLGQAVRRFRDDPEQAFVTIAPSNGAFALERVPVLSSSTQTFLLRGSRGPRLADRLAGKGY